MIIILFTLVITFQSISSLTYNSKFTYDIPYISLYNTKENNLKPLFNRNCQKTMLKNSNSEIVEQFPSVVKSMYEYPEVTSEIW